MISIIGDIHSDIKEDLIDEKINVLESYLNHSDGDKILLGDIFHNRKNISHYALKKLQELFQNCKDDIKIILGNHDCQFKNTLFPNSLIPAFKHLKNVEIITKPTEWNDFLLVPWICSENYNECIDAIRESNKKYLCGHLEINGFYMSRGIECRGGFKKSDLSHYEKVFSGHFHIRSEKDNIIYCGSVCQNDWNDFDNQKGFYILENDDIKFIEGPKQIYKHLIVEDDFDIDVYKDCHVKIYHKKKLTKKQYEKIEELKSFVRSYKIFDESFEVAVEKKLEKIEFNDIIDEYFVDIEIEDELKDDIKVYLKDKYKEVLV